MKKLNIALLVAVLLLAIYLSVLPSGVQQSISGTFLSLLGPFLRTGTAVQEQLGSMGKGLKTLDEIEAENRKLNEVNRELLTTNNLLREIEGENNRLRLALEYRERSVFRLLAARVISRDASTWWNTVKINRGFEDGVETDQPVLTDVGLVGKVTTVSKNESIVVLITDETCRVAAKVEGTREQGILSGMRIQESGTSGELQLNFLTKNAALEPGQKVYTAGISNGVFPSGILIGKVKEFRTRPLDGQALVEPAVDISQTEDLFVVVGAK
ncbi:MAG: rod shape-determining protein MreC [Verrucomicrobia bacterium]|nr:rod shape-determining protein MreC [Verrucomicrobiota bacterium]